MANSNKKRRKRKQAKASKPSPGFPPFPQANGLRAKKILGGSCTTKESGAPRYTFEKIESRSTPVLSAKELCSIPIDCRILTNTFDNGVPSLRQ